MLCKGQGKGQVTKDQHFQNVNETHVEHVLWAILRVKLDKSNHLHPGTRNEPQVKIMSKWGHFGVTFLKELNHIKVDVS